jgi:hypothetical protein
VKAAVQSVPEETRFVAETAPLEQYVPSVDTCCLSTEALSSRGGPSPTALEAGPAAMKTTAGGLQVHPVAKEARSGAVEAQAIAMEASYGAKETAIVGKKASTGDQAAPVRAEVSHPVY